MGTRRGNHGDGCRQVEAVHRQDEQGPAVERERRAWTSNRTSHTSEARSSGATTMIERRDQRSMNTPVNGPRIENGSETISVAIANPSAVLARPG